MPLPTGCTRPGCFTKKGINLRYVAVPIFLVSLLDLAALTFTVSTGTGSHARSAAATCSAAGASPLSRQVFRVAYLSPLRFAGSSGRARRNNRSRSALGALTPIGPFCPFRSDAAEQLNPDMEQLTQTTSEADFVTEMARIQLELQMGQSTPDPDRVRSVATQMEHAMVQWETMITRMRLSSDFQTREYSKFIQAHLQSYNTTVGTVTGMVKWQIAGMRALANNQMPPLPPPELDMSQVMAMMNDAQSGKIQPPPSLTAMGGAAAITAPPFDGPVFDSADGATSLIREEYAKLCSDHESLIQLGSSYGTFDPLGKLRYLDEISAIQDRWNIFYTRIKWMGKLNPLYVKQCQEFLATMNLKEEDFFAILQQSHVLLRQEAEAERS
jgi:Domain of unknown function (DUF1825)